MNPDEVAIIDTGREGARKLSIGLLIRIPILFYESDFARMVMKQRPQDRICGRYQCAVP